MQSYTAMPQTPLDYVVCRMGEFFDPGAPWSRRLWSAGALLALEEVVEAARLSIDGGVTPRALKEVRLGARDTHCQDPGLGDKDLRKALQNALGQPLTSPEEIDRLAHLVGRCSHGYLARWRPVATKTAAQYPERMSRAIASHLLDADLSPERLSLWLVNEARHLRTVEDLVDSAMGQVEQGTRTYEVLVPFRRIPGAPAAVPEGWLTAAETAGWLSARSHKPLSQVGSFVCRIEARDPWAAVAKAAELVDRVRSRLTVGVPGRPAVLDPVGSAFVSGKARPYALPDVRRDVEVHSLSRQDALYRLDSSRSQLEIDFALELLAPLQEGVGAVGLAGGWATIEALYKPSTGAHAAATSAGAVVACSWPRAELTGLAYAYEKAFEDEASGALRSVERNVERCVLIAETLLTPERPVFPNARDECSAQRMVEVLRDSQPILERVARYTSETFKRLYRQRNYLLHSGGARTRGLPAAARTAPALIGAAVDRAVHAAESEGLSSHQLAARAHQELELVGGTGGRHVAALLEPPDGGPP